jgi:ferredoxin-thioredoxin reductase catalytic chain
MNEEEISEDEVDALYQKLKTDAVGSGYFLNPDGVFTRDLIRSLVVNRKRYGYPSCPCRLASGTSEDDSDIVCPCDYRDPDIAEYGACFCALYVSAVAARGELGIAPVPERRPAPEERGPRKPIVLGSTTPSHPVWRCRVCGYLCARDEPPEMCPICKVKKERFERFM